MSPRATVLAMALAIVGAMLPACGGDETLAEPRFFTVAVFVDAGDEPLAAWQVEVVDRARRAQLVSVEGGEHAAFAEPPSYDPRALQGDRVVLIAYHLGEDCPLGRTRVATLHFVQEVAGELQLEARLVAAAGPDGRAVDARVEIET